MDSKSIHSIHSQYFYANVLKADSFVLNILENGLKLPFKDTAVIHNYEEDNNRSAQSKLDIVQDTIDKWERQGKVIKVTEKPLIVNPLSLVEKVDYITKESKFRVVIDMSRYINPLIAVEPVKLDDLSYSEPFLNNSDFMMSFDLKDMYHHVFIHPEHQQYFGFKLNQQYYVFKVLMFGVNYAVFITDRLLKPIKIFLQSHGIHLGIYIDDGRIISHSHNLCKSQFDLVLTVLQCSGWSIQWKKTSTVPSQRLLYLGVITDTVEMKYFTPEHKLIIVRDLLNKCISDIDLNVSIPSNFLAALLGKLAAMLKSHGNIIKVLTRHGQHLLGKAVIESGWDSSIIGDDHLRLEFSLLCDNLTRFNGHSIKSTLKAVKVFSLQDVFEYQVLVPESLHNNIFKFFVSDSSDSQAYTYEAEKFDIVNDYTFSEDEKTFSSGLRELLAVKMAISNNLQYFSSKQNQIIYWLTDSKCNYSFLKSGSRKNYIQTVLLEIKQMELRFNFVIIPIWAPRTNKQIQLADEGSKFFSSTDEWVFDDYSYANICSFFGKVPTIDAFATSTNARCFKFFSKIPQVGSLGVNFFAQNLCSSEVYYCCPPPKLIIHTIKFLLQTNNIQAIVVFPFWKSANYFTFVVRNNVCSPFILAYKLFNPFFSSSHGIFNGYKNFNMMAIFIHSGFHSKSLALTY